MKSTAFKNAMWWSFRLMCVLIAGSAQADEGLAPMERLASYCYGVYFMRYTSYKALAEQGCPRPGGDDTIEKCQIFRAQAAAGMDKAKQDVDAARKALSALRLITEGDFSSGPKGLRARAESRIGGAELQACVGVKTLPEAQGLEKASSCEHVRECPTIAP